MLVVLLLFCGYESNASAQFIQTDLYTYQIPDPKEELAIVLSELGLFVAYLPKRISPIAILSLRDLPPNDTSSIFLAYASQSQVPEKVVLPGRGAEFRIRGTFTVQLAPHIRVSVGMNTSSVPYVSVVDASPGAEAIVGFSGRQMILNVAGGEAIKMLEANPFSRQESGLQSIYELRADKKLYVGGHLVPNGTPLGVFNPAQNDCLKNTNPMIEASSLVKVQEMTPDQQTRALQRMRTKGVSLSSFLVLNADPKLVFGMNFESGKIASIEKGSIGRKSICTYRYLDF